MNGELLRLIDALHREKEIDKEILFEAIEGAVTSAIKKRHNPTGEIDAKIDRLSGAIEIIEDGKAVHYPDMGRIQAQTAKQVIIQKIREAERDVIYTDYEDKIGTIINGNVQRIEGGNLVVNLGRAEGILPKQEKIRGENYQPGDRIKALIYDVKKMGQKVRIMLTRASPDLVVKLFELEVPEIGEKIIEIKRIAREPGYRTKIAVSSYDMRVDCIGACVGIRGSRIKSITDELSEEKIDIIRWNESAEVLIINALKPAQIASMMLDEENKIATVNVPDDMLSLAIGRKGQNVRLATKLTGWDIRIQGSSQESGPDSKNVKEDPEVAGVREALFQGTSFETVKPAGAGSGPTGEEASTEPQESATESQENGAESQESTAESQENGAESQESTTETQEEMTEQQEISEDTEAAADIALDEPEPSAEPDSGLEIDETPRGEEDVSAEDEEPAGSPEEETGLDDEDSTEDETSEGRVAPGS